MKLHFLRTACLILALSGSTFAAPLRIPVWPGEAAPNGDDTTSPATTALTLYRPEHPNGCAMIICPGGGYGRLVAGPEGSGIARWLNQHGITGLVLEYRLPQGKSEVPLLDAQRAIRLARANASEWNINPNRLGIIGFSAGGHLGSTAITHFDGGSATAGDPVERFSSRPDFAVLVYPVITMGELTHVGSRANLLGPNFTTESINRFSSEKQVTAQTPPTFLAHAKDDKLVSPENSRLFAAALKSKNVPVEYLELDNGGHGLNGYKGPSWDAWQSNSLQWLTAQGFLAAKAQPAPKIISAIDPQVLSGLSPLNWIHTTNAVHSSVCGASLKLAFVDTKRVDINVDTARFHYSNPGRYPIVAWTVNNGPIQTHQLVAGETSITLSDSVANPFIDFYIKGLSPIEDRFTGDVPPNALTITGFLIDPNGKILAAPKPNPLWLNIGDSILSGDGAALAAKQGRPTNDLWAASDDARASYGYLLSQHYGYRESRLAFGGYAWAGGMAKNPQVADLIDQLTSTTSRLTGDKLVPCPEVVLINLGENRASNAEHIIAALGKLRLRTNAETKIIVMIPISGKARDEITRAVATYLQTSKDAHTHLLDLGSITFDTCDGQHPTVAGHQIIFSAALPHLNLLNISAPRSRSANGKN